MTPDTAETAWLVSRTLAAIAYAVYTAFCVRLLWHFFLWNRAPGVLLQTYPERSRPSFFACLLMMVDVITLRRVLVSNGTLWLGSLTFHLSFLLVLLRHLRYFTEPVPGCIVDLQACGIIAGYLLPAAALFLLLFRTLPARNRYLTYHNYLILWLVLGIGITGLLMRTLFRVDIVAVKAFAFGLLSLQPQAFQGGYLFVLHLCLVFILVLVLPPHIFSAPLITMEARRREETLKLVLHARQKKGE